MNKTIHKIAVGLVAVAIAAGAGACGTSSSTQGTQSKGKLVLGMDADIPGWDISNQPGYENWAADAVWDNLVKCDSLGKLQEGIAKSWEISKDRKTFTAHLRDGIKFSDGTNLSADDVKASFEYAGKHGGAAGDYKDLKYSIPDENTIVMSWPTSQQVMESKLCASAAHITSKKLIDSGKINDVPVGSGPYIYEAKKSTRGSVYSFKKNSSYWDSKNYPYKTLEIRVIKSQTAAISALTASQIDGAMVSSSNLAKIQAAGLKTKSFSAKTTRLILSDHEGKKIPALGELKVRQAMNMVFDKDAMVKSLYSGHATVTDQVFRPKSDAYIDGLKDPYPFNVKKAKELMKEAGYEKGFSLELPTMEGQDHEVLMPYITEQLAKINITVKQVPLTGANAIGDLLSGDYPVVLWELGNLGNSAQQVQIEMTNTGYWNLSHQPDSYVDGRWEKLATASATESKKMQQEINQYVIDQAWFVPMVYAETFFAHSSRVAIPTSSDIEGISPKLRDFK